MRTRVALIGCGAWGENLLRVLGESPRAAVVAVADPRADRRALAASRAPHAAIVEDLDDAIAAGVDAVLIATPASSHAGLALRAIEAGVDLFVEKPLALSALDAERCAIEARARGLVGMVGHLLLYHPTIVELLRVVSRGELGPLRRFDATRASATRSRETSALWALGPHDLSILFALDHSPIRDLSASPHEGCGVTVRIAMESGLDARIELAGERPAKDRRVEVAGSLGRARFDDIASPRQLSLETRENRVIDVAWREPLAIEVEHFLACVEARRAPRTPLEEGARVAHTLALAEAALDHGTATGTLG